MDNRYLNISKIYKRMEYNCFCFSNIKDIAENIKEVHFPDIMEFSNSN